MYGRGESGAPVKNFLRIGQCQCHEARVSAGWQLGELGFCPPTETGRQKSILPDCISKEWLSFGSLRKTLLGYRSYTETSERDRGRIHNGQHYLVTALRKGGQGPVVMCWLQQAEHSAGRSGWHFCGGLGSSWGHHRTPLEALPEFGGVCLWVVWTESLRAESLVGRA